MKNEKIMGIVFANVHDSFLPELASNRAIASIPFGGRYRLIDFPLSFLVNAGVSTVGVITKFNYHSLMNHLGSGKAFDLDRKNGGLFIFPPYLNREMSADAGHIKSLESIMTHLYKAKEEYIVLCDSDVLANIDIKEMFSFHKEKGADITVAYKKGSLPKTKGDIMVFEKSKNGKITSITFPLESEKEILFSLDIVIMKKSLLIKLIKDAAEKNLRHIWRDVFMPNVNALEIYGYEVLSPAFVIDSKESFAKANFSLLSSETRNALFSENRPIYTKVRDDAPTRYGPFSSVTESIIADGCVIEGEVENSVLFRGVKVEKGVRIKNSIVMQDNVIKKNASLKFTITDKNVSVGEGVELCGSENLYLYIDKNKEV